VPITLEARLRMTVDIAKYFQRHGMESEVKQLRAYYRHLKALMAPKKIDAPPDDALIDHYAAVLKLYPFETQYEVRTESATCTCGAARWRVEEKRFPDRDLLTCRDCKKSWLVLATIARLPGRRL
jgi:hypothetical protein